MPLAASQSSPPRCAADRSGDRLTGELDRLQRSGQDPVEHGSHAAAVEARAVPAGEDEAPAVVLQAVIPAEVAAGERADEQQRDGCAPAYAQPLVDPGGGGPRRSSRGRAIRLAPSPAGWTSPALGSAPCRPRVRGVVALRGPHSSMSSGLGMGASRSVPYPGGSGSLRSAPLPTSGRRRRPMKCRRPCLGGWRRSSPDPRFVDVRRDRARPGNGRALGRNRVQPDG